MNVHSKFIPNLFFFFFLKSCNKFSVDSIPDETSNNNSNVKYNSDANESTAGFKTKTSSIQGNKSFHNNKVFSAFVKCHRLH